MLMMNLLMTKSLEEISGESLNQEIAQATLDELEKVEDLQEVNDAGKIRITCTWIILKKGDKPGT